MAVKSSGTANMAVSNSCTHLLTVDDQATMRPLPRPFGDNETTVILHAFYRGPRVAYREDTVKQSGPEYLIPFSV